MLKGQALAFYARYAPECEMLWNAATDDYREFDRQSVPAQLHPLIETPRDRELVGRLLQTATDEAEHLLDTCREQLMELLQQERGMVATAINDRVLWKREIKARPRKKHLQRFIWLGFNIDIDHDDGHLVARSWIWTRGGRNTRARAHEVIRKSCKSCALSSVNSGSIQLTTVSLGALQDHDGALKSRAIVDKLCAPFKRITADDYAELWQFVREASRQRKSEA